MYSFHSKIVGEDQLSICASEKKILITFTNLEGALSLKLKGYDPTYVLVLYQDKLLYKTKVHLSAKKYTNEIHTENVLHFYILFDHREWVSKKFFLFLFVDNFTKRKY